MKISGTQSSSSSFLPLSSGRAWVVLEFMKDNLLTRPPSALLSSIEAMVREGRFQAFLRDDPYPEPLPNYFCDVTARLQFCAKVGHEIYFRKRFQQHGGNCGTSGRRKRREFSTFDYKFLRFLLSLTA